MTQYNSLNGKLSSLQLNKLKSAIKNKKEVALKLSSNIIGDYNHDETLLRCLIIIIITDEETLYEFIRKYFSR